MKNKPVRPEDTVVRLRVESKITNPNNECYFATNVDKNRIENYLLNEDHAASIPYVPSITFFHHNQLAQIDLSALAAYPHLRHLLHIRPYSHAHPKDTFAPIVVSAEILTLHGARSLRLHFLGAELTHNTEVFGKMKTYLKVWLNGKLKLTSGVDDKGNRKPDYDYKGTLEYSAVGDKVRVEVWDKDLVKDDLVGSFEVPVCQLLNADE